ncbi:hypothetical protein [Clostridium uliginosum]|uniref:Dolichyl-phosphate-mannose-protein mannosyltransferase n=1 Tax=Clostridium uliginosum TaxID=119641 RepID=A0A1I1SUR2_9CLOT|nr:hypothetical protein [Clostridium uliginosum]SFD47643.1 hypothetical protein SAMN05421842_1559 [Clostridium uliginosum]
MKTKKRIKNNYTLFILIAFIIIAVGVTSFVLFKSPHLGIADQGDFDRVMSSSGLSLLDSDKANPDFKRFYDYTVTDYKISNFFKTILGPIIGSSIGILILFISFICKLFNQDIFRTQYLAIAYSFIYIFSLTMILKYLNIKSKLKLTLIGLLSLFVFFDGNYLLWFNSLYGEPMMLTSLLLFIATFLYYINYKYVVKGTDKLTSKIVYVLIASFIFLGSKMQVLTALPFVIILLGKVLWDNRLILPKRNLNTLLIIFFIVIIYPIQLNMINGNISKDTQYNSVFYGVLNGSNTPEQDLIDLGLNPDMSVEAGKHSYLNESDYVKYVPRTEITEKEFYEKIGNLKLAKFYLTHPMRLIQGMEYTADKAFLTSTALGKAPRSYSEKPVKEFNRFTTWSSFKENSFPRNLFFIIGVYLVIFLISLYEYFRNKTNYGITNKIFLLWVIMLIGAIQFPMPFVGNGQADTAKQLYLFNFIFDILLVIIISWCFSKSTKFIKFKGKNKK